MAKYLQAIRQPGLKRRKIQRFKLVCPIEQRLVRRMVGQQMLPCKLVTGQSIKGSCLNEERDYTRINSAAQMKCWNGREIDNKV